MTVFLISIFKVAMSIISGGLLWDGFTPSHHAGLIKKIFGVVASLITILIFVIDIKGVLPDDEASKTEQTKTSVADEWKMVDRYLVKGELVKDPTTGLMWMRCSLGQNWDGSTCQNQAALYTWEQAMSVPKHFDYAGYSDWRVPTYEELKTLVYCSTGQRQKSISAACIGNYDSPTIVKTAFPETSIIAVFWSSSPYTVNGNEARIVKFNYGSGYWGFKIKSNQVRLVRSGQ
jgi:hypothetical protein